jgi:MOSC domain-containing protein YiiM
MQGLLVAIYAGERIETLRSLQEAAVVLGHGVDGDRYSLGAGTFSSYPGKGREVTLIEIETIEALPPECAIEPGEARRNLVTRGISLNDLVGCDFRIGQDVVLRGVRLCHPCDHLEKLTKPGVLKALANRGGLRADVVHAGMIRLGDLIAVE